MATISVNTYVTNFNADTQQVSTVKLMTNERGHMYPLSQLFAGNALGTALEVISPSQAGMAVGITKGYVQIPATGEDYSYLSWLDTDSTLSLDAAESGNARYSAIVAYIDKSIQYSESVTNNPGLMKITEVKGASAAIPSQVGESAIKDTIGSSNPYIILAQVYIPANTTNIAPGNIIDKRVPLSLRQGVALPEGSYATGLTPGTGSSFSNNLRITVINSGAAVPTSTDSDLLVCRIAQ